MKIYPRDIIASLVIIGGIILLAMGKDGTIATLLLMVVTYYFSKRVFEEKNLKTEKSLLNNG